MIDRAERTRTAVRFLMKNGKLRAELTGEHFPAGSPCFENGFGAGDQTVFLVPDSVVKAAWTSMSGSAPMKLSACQKGIRRKPCGECATCDDARAEWFTQALLHAVEARGEMFGRVRSAVMSVLGGTTMSASWEDDMDDEELGRIVNKMKGMKT